MTIEVAFSILNRSYKEKLPSCHSDERREEGVGLSVSVSVVLEYGVLGWFGSLRKLKGAEQTHLKSEWQPARFSNSLANAGFY
jgi:hypothetical protein